MDEISSSPPSFTMKQMLHAQIFHKDDIPEWIGTQKTTVVLHTLRFYLLKGNHIGARVAAAVLDKAGLARLAWRKVLAGVFRNQGMFVPGLPVIIIEMLCEWIMSVLETQRATLETARWDQTASVEAARRMLMTAVTLATVMPKSGLTAATAEMHALTNRGGVSPEHWKERMFSNFRMFKSIKVDVTARLPTALRRAAHNMVTGIQTCREELAASSAFLLAVWNASDVLWFILSVLSDHDVRLKRCHGLIKSYENAWMLLNGRRPLVLHDTPSALWNEAPGTIKPGFAERFAPRQWGVVRYPVIQGVLLLCRTMAFAPDYKPEFVVAARAEVSAALGNRVAIPTDEVDKIYRSADASTLPAPEAVCMEEVGGKRGLAKTISQRLAPSASHQRDRSRAAEEDNVFDDEDGKWEERMPEVSLTSIAPIDILNNRAQGYPGLPPQLPEARQHMVMDYSGVVEQHRASAEQVIRDFGMLCIGDFMEAKDVLFLEGREEDKRRARGPKVTGGGGEIKSVKQLDREQMRESIDPVEALERRKRKRIEKEEEDRVDTLKLTTAPADTMLHPANVMETRTITLKREGAFARLYKGKLGRVDGVRMRTAHNFRYALGGALKIAVPEFIHNEQDEPVVQYVYSGASRERSIQHAEHGEGLFSGVVHIKSMIHALQSSPLAGWDCMLFYFIYGRKSTFVEVVHWVAHVLGVGDTRFMRPDESMFLKKPEFDCSDDNRFPSPSDVNSILTILRNPASMLRQVSVLLLKNIGKIKEGLQSLLRELVDVISDEEDNPPIARIHNFAHRRVGKLIQLLEKDEWSYAFACVYSSNI